VKKANLGSNHTMKIPPPKELEKSTNEELQYLLYDLSNVVVHNISTQHKYIISSMVINEIINRRFFNQQNRNNTRIQIIMVVLTILNFSLFLYVTFFGTK